MKKYIIFVSILIMCCIANAQVFTTSYINDSVEIKEATNVPYYNYKVKNYDNDGYWSKVSNQIINYDDNLQEINFVELSNPRDYKIKYDNKLYLLNGSFHDEYDTNFMPYPVLDSFSFIFYNIERGEESYVNIDDSLVDYNYHYIFLKQSKEFAIVSIPFTDILDTNTYGNANYFKVTILDTLGNVLRSNKINRKTNYTVIEEQGNNIIVSCIEYGVSSNIAQTYFIDKLSLELVDSISNYDNRNYMSIKTINDSIICAFTGSQQLYVDMYNTIDKTFTNNCYNFSSLYIDNNFYWEDFFIDFKNIDSIFFACQLIGNNSPYGSYSYGIEIFNFKLDGGLNYRYLFNNYQLDNVREIHGVTATNDYGLILDINSRVNDNITNAWLLKYSPYGNGNSGINDIETNNQSLVNVYPNPAKDYVNVDIECTNFKESDIELLDMQGRIVKSAKLKAKQGNRIDVSSLNAGAYTYNVSLNGKTISGKIIIGK